MYHARRARASGGSALQRLGALDLGHHLRARQRVRGHVDIPGALALQLHVHEPNPLAHRDGGGVLQPHGCFGLRLRRPRVLIGGLHLRQLQHDRASRERSGRNAIVRPRLAANPTETDATNYAGCRCRPDRLVGLSVDGAGGRSGGR